MTANEAPIAPDAVIDRHSRALALASNDLPIDQRANLSRRTVEVLTALSIRTQRLADYEEKRARSKEASELNRSLVIGQSRLAVPLFLICQAFMLFLEVKLGQYLISLLAPDESNTSIMIATAAIAMIIFIVGHMFATAWLTWVHAPEHHHTSRGERRFAALAMFLGVVYLVMLGQALSIVDAEPGRRILAYVTVFGSFAVQLHRPTRHVWLWFLEFVRLLPLAPYTAIQKRKVMALFGRLVVQHNTAAAASADSIDTEQNVHPDLDYIAEKLIAAGAPPGSIETILQGVVE